MSISSQFITLSAFCFAAATGVAQSTLLERPQLTPLPLSVQQVEAAEAGDLVVLDGGADAGVRQGMTYTVVDGAGEPVADLTITAVTGKCAVALIAQWYQSQPIVFGQPAFISVIR